MRKICAWCKQAQGDVEPLDDPAETHGICRECAKREGWPLDEPYIRIIEEGRLVALIDHPERLTPWEIDTLVRHNVILGREVQLIERRGG